MKKKLNSTSRRKWVVGGVTFFAAVALLTTGLATWVVGTQITTDNENIGVAVDTADNQSIKLTMTLDSQDNGINLSEKVAKGDKQVIANPDGTETDFTITFSEIKVEMGKEYLASHEVPGFTFELDGTIQQDSKVNVAGDLNGNTLLFGKGDRAASTENLPYISLVDQAKTLIPFETSDGNVDSKFVKSESGQYDVYTATNVKLTLFEWGTFFGKKKESPCTFYNNAFPTGEATLEELQKIEAELDAMHTAIAGAGNTFIGLKATLNSTEQGAKH